MARSLNTTILASKMIPRTLTILLLGLCSALAQPTDNGASRRPELEAAIAAIDALPPHSGEEFRIDGYPEAEALRNAMLDKWKQGDATRLAEVIRSTPAWAHSWQVIVKTLWLPAGVAPEDEDLDALKLVFVSSITPGDNWLSEDNPVPKGMTTFQFRESVAERLVKKASGVADIPDPQLLRGNPLAWYEKTFSEKVSPSLLRGGRSAKSSVNIDRPNSPASSTISPVTAGAEAHSAQAPASSPRPWVVAGIGFILLLGLGIAFIWRTKKNAQS